MWSINAEGEKSFCELLGALLKRDLKRFVDEQPGGIRCLTRVLRGTNVQVDREAAAAPLMVVLQHPSEAGSVLYGLQEEVTGCVVEWMRATVRSAAMQEVALHLLAKSKPALFAEFDVVPLVLTAMHHHPKVKLHTV